MSRRDSTQVVRCGSLGCGDVPEAKGGSAFVGARHSALVVVMRRTAALARELGPVTRVIGRAANQAGRYAATLVRRPDDELGIVLANHTLQNTWREVCGGFARWCAAE